MKDVAHKQCFIKTTSCINLPIALKWGCPLGSAGNPNTCVRTTLPHCTLHHTVLNQIFQKGSKLIFLGAAKYMMWVAYSNLSVSFCLCIMTRCGKCQCFVLRHFWKDKCSVKYEFLEFFDNLITQDNEHYLINVMRLLYSDCFNNVNNVKVCQPCQHCQHCQKIFWNISFVKVL